jgi:hypothetical protein
MAESSYRELSLESGRRRIFNYATIVSYGSTALGQEFSSPPFGNGRSRWSSVTALAELFAVRGLG